MAIPDLLRGCPLFFELYDDEIEKIVKYCSVYTLAAGQYAIREGDEGDEIFVVLEGSLAVQKATPDGVIHIHTLGVGDVFGEMVLVDDRTRSADIVSKSASYVLEIKYKSLFGLFDKEPKVFSVLILNLSRLMAKRLKSSNQLIVKLQKAA